MASWWQILEIEKDGLDDRTIKRAYAKKLKSIRQEDDPAGFIALREAYDQGRNYLKYQSSNQIYNAEFSETIANLSDREITSELTTKNSVESQPNKSLISPVDKSLNAVEKLIANPWGRNEIDSWRQILQHERLDSIDDFTDFEPRLLAYLLDIHGYYSDEAKDPKISIPVAQYIFDRLGWNTKRKSNDSIAGDINWLAQTLSAKYDDEIVQKIPFDQRFYRFKQSTTRLFKKGLKFVRWYILFCFVAVILAAIFPILS